MSRGIKLVLQTRSGIVDSGILLLTDEHVRLAYCMIEEGMFSTMGRKHWHFAVTDGNILDAMLPCYRKVAMQNGLEKYVPRIPAKNIRNSVSGLLIALEGLSDGRKAAQEAGERQQQEEALSIQRLERIVEADKADGAPASASPVSMEPPASEIITLGDGSQIEVLEWEQASAEEVNTALGCSTGAIDSCDREVSNDSTRP